MRYFLLCLFLLLTATPAWNHCAAPLNALPNVHVDQFGYPTTATKIAVIANPQTGYNSATTYTPPATLDVRRADTGATVTTCTPSQWNSGATHTQSGDKAWWCDVSSVTTAGDYYLYDATLAKRGDIFTVGAASTVYKAVLKAAVRMLFYQRAGMAKAVPYTDPKWVDGASYLGTGQDSQARAVTDQSNAGTAKDVSGGWWDAGDTNKYTPWGADAVTNLLHAYQQAPSVFTDDFNLPESGNGIPDLLDEVKWELDWLLRMQTATGNGSVLCKVSVLTTTCQSGPVSADTRPRYWGAASTHCTAKAAAAFAFGAVIFAAAGQTTYAATLTTAAGNAWTWAAANTAVTYPNTGFGTANPDPNDAYARDMARLEAAIYLYARTGTTTYRTYVDSNYTNAHALAWTYWYAFEASTQNALLTYTTTAGATAGTVTAIRTSKISSIGGSDFTAAYTGASDAYRAYLKDSDWSWGSNRTKAESGNLFLDLIRYNLDTSNHATYKAAGAGFTHYLHGVNPNGIVFLTNMAAVGAERSVNETYHCWFQEGSAWSNAITSLYGPAPGYVAGGPNPTYTGTATPPLSQPIQKAWKDSNISFPDNMYEITEPAILYQAAYIRLLAGVMAFL